jgi:hypothetical protein
MTKALGTIYHTVLHEKCNSHLKYNYKLSYVKPEELTPSGVFSEVLGTMLQPARSWVRDPMRPLNLFNLPNPSSHTRPWGLQGQ